MAASVQEELTRMRIILQDLEARLDAGEVPPEGLPEFKSTVDEIRLRVWGLLTAAGTEAPREAVERFRLRRAAEYPALRLPRWAAKYVSLDTTCWCDRAVA